jgi:sigma-E factor negative regulatory protein RseC
MSNEIEEGIIIKTHGKTATVQIKRSSSCSHCKACNLGDDGNMTAEAENPIDAKVGDKVGLNLNSKKALTASLVVFGLPLLALCIGIIGTSFVIGKMEYQNNSQTPGIIVGLALFFLSFIPIKAYDKHLRKTNTCSITIVEIIKG